MKKLALIFLAVSSSALAAFSPQTLQHFQDNMLANIAPNLAHAMPGAIMASPGLPTKGFSQNYRFNWVRDAALTMGILITEYQHGDQQLEPYFNRYVNFMQHVYRESSHYGYSTLGQPKINLNGSLWQAPWARPQNDGPALSAIDLVRIAEIKLKQGHAGWVKQYLFNPKHPRLVQQQLNYITHNWHNTSYGIWEEVRGMHFFVAMAQYQALVQGARLAYTFHDKKVARRYTQTAAHLNKLIHQFWQTQLTYIPATLHQQFIKGGGLDSSVMLAALYTNLPHSPAPITLTSPEMLATVAMLRAQFHSLYPINWSLKHAVWLGRYPNDIYDGNTFKAGNPWILITTELGEYDFRVAHQLKQLRGVQPTWFDLRFFQQVAPSIQWHAGKIYSWKKNKHALNSLIKALMKSGNMQLQLIQTKLHCHLKQCDQLNEQVNRLTGKLTSAPDLTWNYVALLRASRQS